MSHCFSKRVSLINGSLQLQSRGIAREDNQARVDILEHQLQYHIVWPPDVGPSSGGDFYWYWGRRFGASVLFMME
jgi:hypothetical protein